MTRAERERVAALLEIADEDDSPISEWESEFLNSINDKCQDKDLSMKQSDVLDRLVKKHLRDNWDTNDFDY